MFSIGQIPGILQSFFRPLRSSFTDCQWKHFWPTVLALIALPLPRKIIHLAKVRRQGRHRTNLGAFFKRSPWDPARALMRVVLRLFFHMNPEPDELLEVILDDTKIAKRAKSMDGVGRLFDSAKKVYAIGHTVLLTALRFRGILLPWRWDLYLKKEFCAERAEDPDVPAFRTLTELAAASIRLIPALPGMSVRVLFDSYYLCKRVVRVIRDKGYTFISVAKSNRVLWVRGQKKHVRPYGERVLRRSGKKVRLPGGRKARIALRKGTLKGVGEVLVLFSRRQGERKVVAIVTNDLTLTAEQILAGYKDRWPIEIAFKDQKQHLGLGDYQTRSLRGVVTHLHLVAIAHVLLTHHAVKALGAQAQQKNTVLQIPTVQDLREAIRRALWNDALNQLKKKVKRPAALRYIKELYMAA